MPPQKCLILVGHGAVPTDCPPGLVAEFKRLEAAAKGRPSPGLAEADAKLRAWPRSPRTDPYQAGLEAVASALRRRLPDRAVLAAYNEFCGPSLPEALDSAAAAGAREITVISTMFTRGGIHSETEIPELVAQARRRHPAVSIRYAWPFELDAVAGFLAGEVGRAEASPLKA